MKRFQTDEIHLRDPFILPTDGIYYLYGTRCGGAPGFDVYTGSDLLHWEGPYPVFTRPDGFWADQDFWAPEVHVYQGQYYMLASFKSPDRCRGTQILQADTPLGPFIPLTNGPVTPSHWECLDGTLYVEGGTPYLVFCHEWLQVRDGEMCAMALTPDLYAPAGEPAVLFRASEPAWAIRDAAYYVTDGPWLHRTKSGSLLMLWSSGTATGYSEAISRSLSGTLAGPWVHDPALLITYGGGHGMTFRSFQNQLLFLCHQPNRSPLERPKIFPLQETTNSLIRL